MPIVCVKEFVQLWLPQYECYCLAIIRIILQLHIPSDQGCAPIIVDFKLRPIFDIFQNQYIVICILYQFLM